MKYTELVDFFSIPPSELHRYLTLAFRGLRDVVNSGITFSDNLNGKILTVTFTDTNTDTTFTHSLGRIPSAYMVRRLSDNMVVYDSSDQGRNWTSDRMSLRSSAPGTVTLYIE